MKNSIFPSDPNVSNQNNSDLTPNDINNPELITVSTAVPDFNDLLFNSLPYPAMFIRRKDRIVIAANKIAQEFGAKVGGHCWSEFGKSKSELKSDDDILNNPVYKKKYRNCTFCQGDKCFTESQHQNNPELYAFGKIWNTFWIKVNNEVFFHYLIDITEHRKLEESLRESESYLKQTQQIAMLGTYNLNITSGTWESSEVLDEIFGIEPHTKKTFEEWIFIIHPDMQEVMINYFYDEVIGKKKRFDKEYKIKRQSDGEERWVHGIGDLKFNEKNEPLRMIGTIHDITERKRSEDEN